MLNTVVSFHKKELYCEGCVLGLCNYFYFLSYFVLLTTVSCVDCGLLWFAFCLSVLISDYNKVNVEKTARKGYLYVNYVFQFQPCLKSEINTRVRVLQHKLTKLNTSCSYTIEQTIDLSLIQCRRVLESCCNLTT